MPELGRAALVATLGLAVYAVVAGSYAAWKGRRRLALSAQNALMAAFGTSIVASLVLVAALIRHDFSFVYAAEHTSRELPTGYTISAFWGGQEGSLLLWLLILTGYSTAVLLVNRRTARDLVAWVTPVLGGVTVFFAFLLVVVATPFATQAAPADGNGLNPSLQNPYMMAHPPLLYLGFVGLTVPFAFATGALLARRNDERWIIATRRWTLVAWTALGVGQLLGSHWAYQEVGWGGYYAWDPVENAALMPWLAATAFLHSVMIQEKRGMLRVWNHLLVVMAFCALALRDVPDPLRDRQLDPLLHAELDRAVVPRLHLHRRLRLARPHLRPAPAAAVEDAARVAHLARGDVPLQQPAARRADADDPLGRRLPDPARGRPRRVADRRPRLLQLLPPRLRAAAAAADGDRAARGLAAGVAAQPRDHVRLAGRLRAARRPRPAPPRRGIVDPGPDRLHVLGVRARLDRARVHPRHARPPSPLRRLLALALLVPDRPQPPPLRRLHRPRRDRPARDRHRRLERLRHGQRAPARTRRHARRRRLHG